MNKITQTFWIVKHVALEDPNSKTPLANYRQLMDHTLTIPLHRFVEPPIGHEPGEVGPNLRLPTPEEKEYRQITEDILYPEENEADPIIMRKKLDHPAIFCEEVVETGKTIEDENGRTLREVKVTYTEPWHGTANGGNRMRAIRIAKEIAYNAAKNGDFSLVKKLAIQYIDCVFSTGYTQEQSHESGVKLNITKQVQRWAQLHHNGKFDWFIDSLDGNVPGHQDDYLKSINPNLSERIVFIAGQELEVTVEEALQIVRMFNREEFPHIKKMPLGQHEAKSRITKDLDSETSKLYEQFKALELVAPYLLMFHDYIRLNATNWRSSQEEDTFYVRSFSKTNYDKVVFLDQEAKKAYEEKSKLLVRSLAHPLCWALSQFLKKNEKGHWEFLSNPNNIVANSGQRYTVSLDYRSMLSIIDDIGPDYMLILWEERGGGKNIEKKLNGFLREPRIWTRTYTLVKEYIQNHPTWNEVAFLPEPLPESDLGRASRPKKQNTNSKIITSQPKPAMKVINTLNGVEGC